MKLILWWSFCFGLADFAVECMENVYGLNGKSVRLTISPKKQQNTTEWRRFNRAGVLTRSNEVAPFYAHRMKLNVTDWSLTIEKLEKSDSGLYEALQNWERDVVAAFVLTVENPVSEPVISVKDYNSSEGVCQATVNCSLDGSWAAYDCDQYRCERTHAALSSINITVTALDRSIQCHANNHVSKNHSETPNIMCYEKQHGGLPSPPKFTWWIIFTISAGVFLLLFTTLTVVIVAVKKRVSSKVHPQSIDGTAHHQTVYSTEQKPNASQRPPENTIEGTIYDVPSRRPVAHRAESEEVMIDNQEKQKSGQDKTVKVRATVHQAAEADSDQINTIYCKLGEI